MGAQIECFSILSYSENVTSDVSVGIGTTDVHTDRRLGNVSYLFSAYNFRYRRFVSQIGAGWMISHSGDIEESVVLTVQLGLIAVRF